MKLSVGGAAHIVGEREQFAYLKSCGFDACDFPMNRYFFTDGIYKDIDNVTDEMIAEHFTMLREEAEKVGFEIGQTHSQFTGHPSSYGGNIEEVIKREIACIKATHYLGCKYCVIHPIIKAGRRYDILVKEAFDESVEFYKRLIPTLEEYDVYCCIENMWNFDPVYKNICSTILSHAQEMVDMCELLGDRFRICVDIGHGTLTQDDPAQMIRICGDKLACLHAHDNDGIEDMHSFPFTPYAKPHSVNWSPMRVNWNEIMNALDEVDYRGNLNFEVVVPGPRELHEAGLKYLSAIANYLVSLRKVKY